MKNSNIKTKLFSFGLALMTAMSLVVTPVYATETTSETEESTQTTQEETSSENSEETTMEETNNTLITVVAKNTDENQRVASALVSIKDSKGNTLSFKKTGDSTYEYSTSGSTTSLETNSKGKLNISYLPEGTYTVTDVGTSSDYISTGSSKFVISSLLDQMEIEMDYTLNVGTLSLTFTDGDDNSAIEKAIFILKDSMGNLMDVTCTATGTYECSKSNSGAGDFLTNAAGKVTVSKIPAGTYTIEETYSPAKYNSGYISQKITISANEITNVSVSNSKKYGDLNVKLTSTSNSSFSGYEFKIANSEGYAVPVHEVSDNAYAYNRNGEDTIVSVKSASDLVVSGLPEGTYTFHQEKGISDYKKLSDVTFKVENGKVTSITLNPQRAVGSISITKTDADTKDALEGFKVNIINPDTKEPMKFVLGDDGKYTYSTDNNSAITDLTTNKDGKILAIGIPTGTIIIRELSAPDGYIYSRNDIEQTISADIETVFSTTSKKSNCALSFVDADGKPIEGVSVKVTNSNDEVIIDAKSNANGYVLMSNISSGTFVYEVTGVPSGYSLPKIKSDFTVDNEGVASGLEAITIDCNKISITISGVEKEKAGFEFSLTDADGNVLKAITDENGVAEFTKIPYGTYTLKQISALSGYSVSTEIYNNILVDDKFSSSDNKYTFNLKEATEETTASESLAETKNGGIKAIIVVLVLILLAAIGGIVYFVIKSKKEQNTDNNEDDAEKDVNASDEQVIDATEEIQNELAIEESSNLEETLAKEVEQTLEEETIDENKEVPEKEIPKKEKISNQNKNSNKEKKNRSKDDNKDIAPEPIIIEETPEEETIIETTQTELMKETIVVPEDINDRKPTKGPSAPIDPFSKN